MSDLDDYERDYRASLHFMRRLNPAIGPTTPPLHPKGRPQMSRREYCEHCCNTGWLDCHCGGDLCICENNGDYPCPHCDGMSDDDDHEDEEDGKKC
jgi:hypothetical protein